MSKALIVSFFKSNNLGDLALSSAIENLITNKGYDLIKCDFATASFINDNREIRTNLVQKKLILKSVISIIKKTLFLIFGTRNVDLVKYHFRSLLTSRKWEEVEERIKVVDLLVIGGGNMLMDITPSWPDIFSRYLSLAKKYNKKIYVVYVGAGPIFYKRSEDIYKKVLKYADKISVRDPLSQKVCNDLVSEKLVNLTIDPVFSLPIDMKDYRLNSIADQTEGTNFKIGISVLGEVCFESKVAHNNYLKSLLKLVSHLVELSIKRVEITLFSTDIADYSAVYKFKSMLTTNNCDYVSVANLEKIDEIIKLYKQIHFLIGGRMHGLIFAQKCLLPFIGIVWQDKIKGFSYVTKSNNRIYEVDDIYEKYDFITNQIIMDGSNIKLVEQMHEINELLNDIVLEGSID